MKEEDRIRYSIKNQTKKSVAIFPRYDWNKLILSNGEPTVLCSPPSPISRVQSDAAIVAMAASGEVNPNPGFDIVRRDLKDAPYIYNIDHYVVIENLSSHPNYSRYLSGANLKQDKEIEKSLSENVFIVGPYKEDNHWVTEIPQYIAQAKSKI